MVNGRRFFGNDRINMRTFIRAHSETANPDAIGSSCARLAEDKEAKLKSWVTATLPRSTHQVGGYIEREFGVAYESRSGLIGLLRRLGREYVRPETIGRELDAEKQKAFIEAYENLLNSLGPDEAVLFMDAVHPAPAVRPEGCWAPATQPLAIEQTSGRQRLNIHGAIDLETGETAMIDVDAASTIRMMQAIEALYSLMATNHMFLDNARDHPTPLSCRNGWRSPTAYCPLLNPSERLWDLIHKHLTHNKTLPVYRELADQMLHFLRNEVPQRWGEFCDLVTDNFRGRFSHFGVTGVCDPETPAITGAAKCHQ